MKKITHFEKKMYTNYIFCVKIVASEIKGVLNMEKLYQGKTKDV